MPHLARPALLALSLLLALGCETGTAPPERDGGGGGGVDSGPAGAVDSGRPGFTDSGPPRDAGGGPTDPLCGDDASRWIYLVDSDDAFLRYDPAANALEMIGTLSCPSSSSPFSMSVDRDARAWVLYQDNRIYHVDTTTLGCTASDFTPGQMGFELFGMGFAADADGSEEETLHIAGGSAFDMILGGGATLGAIDPGALTVSSAGSLPGWPELTGTGAGELWGFFPDTTPPSVRRIDKATGATPETFSVADLESGGPGNPFGGDRAWAFAFWGGRFYIFYKGDADTTTNIWRLDPTDGSLVEVLPDTGYRIVGAGVSTCAPIVLI